MSIVYAALRCLLSPITIVENETMDIFTLQSSPNGNDDWSIVTNKKKKKTKENDKENEKNGVTNATIVPKNGRVEYVDEKGNTYIVNYENGMINGKGKIITAYGTIDASWSMGTMNSKILIYYNDGSNYWGEAKDLLKHGSGQMFHGPTSESYDGSFVDDKRHGEGIYCTEHYVYQGQFHDDRITGYGSMYYNDGNVYTGDHLDGMKHGFGSFYNASTNDFYEGNYEFDEMSGFGTHVSAGKGSRGHFKNGSLYGKGVKINPNREFDKIIGEFDENGLVQGHLIATYHSGDKFEGTAIDGKIHCGTITKNNNTAVITGTFSNSCKLNYGLTGLGTIVYHYTDTELEYCMTNDSKKPIKEECYYKDGVREGHGTMYYNNGSIYTGQYVNGKQQGKGKYIWSSDKFPVWHKTFNEAEWKRMEENEDNGSTIKRAWYEGDWVDNERCGEGYMELYYDVLDNDDSNKTRWYAGDRYQGSWQRGNRHGHGTLTNTITGEKFIGVFKNHYKSSGILYNADGSIKLQGEWIADVFLDPKANVKQMIYEIVSESYIEYVLGEDED